MEQYQLTAVCFNDDSTSIFTGGIDGVIRQYDLRKISSKKKSDNNDNDSDSDNDNDNNDSDSYGTTSEPVMKLKGHTDIITSLEVSPSHDYYHYDSYNSSRHYHYDDNDNENDNNNDSARGQLLLSNSMDNSMRIWDLRPFVARTR